MLFNSFSFLVFFPLVATGYFLLPFWPRTLFLLSASSLFYMWFIPKYILILLITIGVDYVAGIFIEKAQGRSRTLWLIGSIFTTCAVLFCFKYWNFFWVSAGWTADLLGWSYTPPLMDILLPIGLSFHTFQSLSYVIEVYRGNQKAEKNFIIYSLYVMFFPQLVAGPIERPQNLLSQFRQTHTFDYIRVTQGLKRMAWGLFKKIVIADRLALYVNDIYDIPVGHTPIELILATFFFSIQIYCDFSGYSDIAIGSAQVLGFKLTENFKSPYFSKSISEFWTRWHISLSSWFKDYVYIPLGGSQVSLIRWHFNILLTFLLSGLWHGAKWTFVLWGLLNGIYLIVEKFISPFWNRHCAHPSLAIVPPITTFFFISVSWIFFRATDLNSALWILKTIFIPSRLHLSKLLGPLSMAEVYLCIVLIFTLFSVEWSKRFISLQAWVSQQKWVVRWAIYYAGGLSLFYLRAKTIEAQQFIYFQF